MNWLLPEHIADALPAEASLIERLRRTILDQFARHGYQLVMPPLLEYIESLRTGSGKDLDLKTFKLVDQASGRTMGIRADMTPQVARIDAHILNCDGVSRLCYCDSVLHTLPSNSRASREPIQLGAELFGYSGEAADVEIIRLMVAIFRSIDFPLSKIVLGHVDLFAAIVEAAAINSADESEILLCLQRKDNASLQALVQPIPAPWQQAILSLPEFYGDTSVIDTARRQLPAHPRITQALDALSSVVTALAELPLAIDLADCRSYYYHSGINFAAYVDRYPFALVKGGRYDGVGAVFGRNRPATGFSLDLRELAQLCQAQTASKPSAIIYVAANDSLSAQQNQQRAAAIDALRHSGKVLIELLPGEQAAPGGQYLKSIGDTWVVGEY